MAPSLRWDVFCRVVDNFGDAGVCWRLARQLAREHGLAVTLWIDDVASLARFAPGLSPQHADQACAGVRVRRIAAPFRPESALPDVVVEGFGCGLPEPYVEAMAAQAKPARVGGARVPVRGAVDRRLARACPRRTRALR